MLVLSYRQYLSYSNENSSNAFGGRWNEKQSKIHLFPYQTSFLNETTIVWKLKFVMGTVFSGKVSSIGGCRKKEEISVGIQLCSELVTDESLSF